MEPAKRGTLVSAAEPLTEVKEQLGELLVASEIGPVAADRAAVVSPEGTRIAGAPSRAPRRVIELADAMFHANRVAPPCRADIRVGAAPECGLLPSRDPVALIPLELDVDEASASAGGSVDNPKC